MKEPKNIRIVLTPIGQSNRGDLELIENDKFNSKNSLARKIKQIVGEDNFKVLTVAQFRTELAFQPKAYKSFATAITNLYMRKQCYKLTDFMDDFNNQEFGGETDKFWLGYVKLK
jgi:hypothetical protein